MSAVNPVPQLVVQAITTFQYNNHRLQELEMDPLAKAIISGITMVGITPTFFHIPVTVDLANAIHCETFPQMETIVQMYCPLPHKQHHNGMMPVQNCLIVLRQASLETSTVYISCF
jgi:hypothetical protein